MSQHGQSGAAARVEVAPEERLCPKYHRAVEIVGKRWTGLILRVLLDGPHRFGELHARIEGLSERVLSERLKELEAHGIVERRVFRAQPARVEYHLTAKGHDLQSVIQALQGWADRWDEGPPAPCPDPVPAHTHAVESSAP